eukprot:g32750.t1
MAYASLFELAKIKMDPPKLSIANPASDWETFENSIVSVIGVTHAQVLGLIPATNETFLSPLLKKEDQTTVKQEKQDLVSQIKQEPAGPSASSSQPSAPSTSATTEIKGHSEIPIVGSGTRPTP